MAREKKVVANGDAPVRSEAAELASKLFRDCPFCAAVCPLFDRFLEVFNEGRAGLSVVGRPVNGTHDVALQRHTIRLHCETCKGQRRVLTDLGREVVDAAKKQAPPEEEEHIPF